MTADVGTGRQTPSEIREYFQLNRAAKSLSLPEMCNAKTGGIAATRERCQQLLPSFFGLLCFSKLLRRSSNGRTPAVTSYLIQDAEVCQAKTDILQQSPCVAFTIFTVFTVFAVFTVFPEGRYHYICSDMRYYLRQIPTAVLYFHCRKDPVRDPGLIRRESPHRDHPQSLLKSSEESWSVLICVCAGICLIIPGGIL